MDSKSIFLAHAREDKARVRELYEVLKSRGFEPWLDEKDLIPGQNWRIVIPNAIRDAAIFLACLSSRSAGKKHGYLNAEFRTALAAYGERPPGSIFIIPVKLDECDIPDLQIPNQGLSLRDLHWVELANADGFDLLLRALRFGLGLAQPEDKKVVEQPQPSVTGAEKDGSEGSANRGGSITVPEMILIGAGSFFMGCDEEEAHSQLVESPKHEVAFHRDFKIGKFAVTFQEYDDFCAETGRKKPNDEGWGRGRRPVINVSCEDAEAYCEWLGWRTGEIFRLPSEAEWEYCCRAGSKGMFNFGWPIGTDRANYDGRYTFDCSRKGANRGKSVDVGSFMPNSWGLYEMHGNVAEWCADCWNQTYSGAPADGSAWRAGDCMRGVIRGGSWFHHPQDLRSTWRGWALRSASTKYIGFRIAMTIKIDPGQPQTRK